MKWFVIVWLVFCAVFASASVDREAFTFTSYDLNVRVEADQHRLAVRGKVTLRNDSSTPQKNLALQISSSLDWRSIQIDGKPVDFVSQSYASDIDHTGALSEAIVSLPAAIAPKGTVEVEVGYDGVVVQDATRLTRIGIPQGVAKHSEWDEIDKSFTAVRGIGYVAWYPVAVEAASLSEGSNVEDAIARWKTRTFNATMTVNFEPLDELTIFFNGTTKAAEPRISVPTFVMADYRDIAPDDHSEVYFLPWQDTAAKTYADAITTIAAMPPVGAAMQQLRIFGLPDADDLAFATDGILFTPLKSPITNDAMLNIVYAKAFSSITSPRAWIQDGLAHFAQAMFIAQDGNSMAALDYMKSHQAALVEAEKQTAPPATNETVQSLMNAPDGLYLQTKAMFVWWMLRDMLGTDPRMALLNYKAAEDTDPKYLQGVLEKATHRDLGWFFNDWVYHDRGLPEFRVAYVNSAPVLNGGYLVTVTVENLGVAGAEVPLTLRMEQGQMDKRIEVRGKSKATVRLQAAAKPVEIVINDGSVPESDMTNNTYEIPADSKVMDTK